MIDKIRFTNVKSLKKISRCTSSLTPMQMNTNKWPAIKTNENGKGKFMSFTSVPSSLKHRINNIRNQKHTQTGTGNEEADL
jgi:hypothetical protein